MFTTPAGVESPAVTDCARDKSLVAMSDHKPVRTNAPADTC